MARVVSVSELERVVGKQPPGAMLKTIDVLDPHRESILAHSTAAVVGYVDEVGRQRAALVGGEPGFASPRTPYELDVPLPPTTREGAGVSLLMLIPGVRETLRINGLAHGGVLRVREAYLHCAKSIIRSDLWAPARPVTGPEVHDATLDADVAQFLSSAPFLVIASRDRAGNSDCSPRGDPIGSVRIVDSATVAVADRPGNKRTDTLHNLIEQPAVAVLALVPGDERTLELSGTATISTDDELRSSMVERGKTPNAAMVLRVETARLMRDPALESAALWDIGRHVDRSELPRPATVFADHVKLGSGSGGFGSRVLRAMASEKLLEKGLELDYRRNLY